MSRHWSLFVPPRLDWLQVEISTHCNASCFYCPRTQYASCWRHSLMPLGMFGQLAPVLKKTRFIHLQGWGEPLTHPSFFDFVRVAQASGCQVGVTTNGMLCTEAACQQLIEAEIDVVAFSLAGIDEENDRIRRGTRLEKVLAVIARLAGLKRQLGVSKPAVHIAYLLLRSRRNDLDALPSFCASLGVDQVVISTLDMLANRDLAAEALIPAHEEEYALLRQQLDDTIAAGRALGVPIHAWLAKPRKSREVHRVFSVPAEECTEHVEKAAFIGVDGSAGPCVYANLPLAADVTHWAAGRETTLTPLIFGHLDRQAFATIWYSRQYRIFRQEHREGRLAAPCSTCVRTQM